MLSSNQNQKLGIGQPSLLTFEDFEDNEEYDKILTFEELRKKAADFISVRIILFRKNKIRSKRKRKSVPRRNDNVIFINVIAINMIHSRPNQLKINIQQVQSSDGLR
jgi:hypothetical protein